MGHRPQLCGVRPARNGATVLLYEGAPDMPDKDRFWRIIANTGDDPLHRPNRDQGLYEMG